LPNCHTVARYDTTEGREFLNPFEKPLPWWERRRGGPGLASGLDCVGDGLDHELGACAVEVDEVVGVAWAA
jgi:hypothetical protein